MVGIGGLEPPTSPLSGVRSNQLSYTPTTILWYKKNNGCLYIHLLRKVKQKNTEDFPLACSIQINISRNDKVLKRLNV